MITPKEVLGQIERLTGELIATGLCDAQNFPSMNDALPFKPSNFD